MSNMLMNTLDADQRRGVENIREAANRIWARPLHRYFTDHTVAHSERIITLMDGLTAGMMAVGDKRLSPTEVLVLLSAAYLHDIGMQNEKFAKGNLDEIRAHHNEQTAEMIYKVFEDPANAFAIPLARDPSRQQVPVRECGEIRLAFPEHALAAQQPRDELAAVAKLRGETGGGLLEEDVLRETRAGLQLRIRTERFEEGTE